MKETINIFKQLQSTNGRLDKEQILKDNQTNKDFKYFLKFLLDPFVITGIGKKKLSKFMRQDVSNSYKFDNFKEVCEYIKLNNTGTDEVVSQVASFVKSQDEDEQEYLVSIIQKSLKLGITANTVNKVYGKGYINQFKVQLAKSYEDEMHKVISDFTLTEKLDGMRALITVNNEDVKIFSRQGKPILGLVDIIEEAKTLEDGVYDGELLIENDSEYSDRDVLQETLKITRKDGDKIGVLFHVFDYVTLEEFDSGTSKYNYTVRRKLFEQYAESKKWIKPLPTIYTGKEHNIIPTMLEELEEQGREGLMLNINDSRWKNKRVDSLLKIKSMNEFDEKITDIIEGEGRLKGTLGAVVVDYKGQNELNIGSGFTDSERSYFWENKDKLIGRVITIQHFRESQNADGKLSVSFPVFKQLREEGKEVSYY